MRILIDLTHSPEELPQPIPSVSQEISLPQRTLLDDCKEVPEWLDGLKRYPPKAKGRECEA